MRPSGELGYRGASQSVAPPLPPAAFELELLRAIHQVEQQMLYEGLQ